MGIFTKEEEETNDLIPVINPPRLASHRVMSFK